MVRVIAFPNAMFQAPPEIFRRCLPLMFFSHNCMEFVQVKAAYWQNDERLYRELE